VAAKGLAQNPDVLRQDRMLEIWRKNDARKMKPAIAHG
jgi:hypothetical protein